METQERLKNWLINMGYQGKMPASFEPFCNSHTALIWEQLMQQVKPKDEIARIRNTILINRHSSLNESNVQSLQNEFKAPIREMEMWKKKQSLRKDISEVREQIMKLRSDLDDLEKINKMKHLKIEGVRAQIRGMRNRTSALNHKRDQLRSEIAEVQDLLTTACNLTPVEADDERKHDAAGIVGECIVQLEKMIELETCKARRQQNQCDGSNNSLGLLSDTVFIPIGASSPVKMAATDGILFDLSTSNDVELQRLLQFLFKFNRHNVWNYICESNEVQARRLMDSILSMAIPGEKAAEDNKSVISKLYWTHIDFELKAIQSRANVTRLQNEISSYNTSNLSLNAKQKQKEYGLIRAIEHMRNFIDSSASSATDLNLAGVEGDIAGVEREIREVLDKVCLKQSMFRQLLVMMNEMRDNTRMLTKKLAKFTADGNWMQLLSNNVCAIEVATFLNYPLETRPSQSSLSCESYDSNTLQQTLTLLPNPWCPPEVMLMKLIRQKEQLQFMKSSCYTFNTPIEKGTPNLVDQESFINYAVDKLLTLMNSKTAMFNLNKDIQKCIDIWMNMPIRQFVAETRIFNGFPYSHYEELYESFYKQL